MEEKNLNNTQPSLHPVPAKKSNAMVAGILGLAGLVLVISIIGVGALLAGHVWNPAWNPFKSNSDKMIREKILKEIKK